MCKFGILGIFLTCLSIENYIYKVWLGFLSDLKKVFKSVKQKKFSNNFVSRGDCCDSWCNYFAFDWAGNYR